MTNRSFARRAFLGLGVASIVLAQTAVAATGTWTSTAPTGTWTLDTNWLGNTIADGAGNTANFISDITAATTVTLGADRTIGSIVFSDNGALGSAWTLTGNTLNLSGGTPTLTTTTNATIESAVSATAGLTKLGAGSLTLSGPITGGGNYFFNAGSTTLSGGATGIGAFNVGASAAGSSASITSGAYSIGSVSLNNFGAASTATYTQSGGTVNVAGLFFLGQHLGGGGTTNTANFTGGSLTIGGDLQLYKWANCIVNVSGGASVTAARLYLGWVDASPTGTINIGDGTNFSGGTSGTMSIGSVFANNNRNYTLNMHGGTLKATAAGNWIGAGAFTNAFVKESGGIIDNGNFNISIGQVFSHGGVSPIDGGLTFAGSGATTLDGANTYNGPTTLSAGTLIVNGGIANSAVGVNAGTLAGGGTTGLITLAGGTLAPSGDGSLASAGVSFNSGTFSLDITGPSGYDQLNVGASNNVAFNGLVNLAINLGIYNPVDDGSLLFTIVNNLSSNPVMFANGGGFTVDGITRLAEGASFVAGGQSFSITYQGGAGSNDVVIAAVPEPGAVSAILGGMAVLMGTRRRRTA